MMECYGYVRKNSCKALTECLCSDGAYCPFHKPKKQFIAELRQSIKNTTNQEYKDCMIQILADYGEVL